MSGTSEYRNEHRLSDLARAGFQDLSRSRALLLDLAELIKVPSRALLEAFTQAADPDAALHRTWEIGELHVETLSKLDPTQWDRFALLIGASPALGAFFARQPGRLRDILERGGVLYTQTEAAQEFHDAVSGADGKVMAGEQGWNALRVRYRELLSEVLLHDLRKGQADDASEAFDEVSLSLSALAGAALEVSLAIARASLILGESGSPVPEDRVDAIRLAVIAMGKCGAEELNVVSDVDVMFIAESNDPEVLDQDRLIRLGTRLASETMRVIHDPAFEPPLWQVDPNLRPEGRQGALVRTLSSMMNYYERWARTWEFQALLKARALAGDLELGRDFVERVRPLVWESASRSDFVGSVRRMRERVTEHITDADPEAELKLGPGGLRDIEFSVQLLQLVHGQFDERLHLRGTLMALQALVDGGYVARSDGERLAADYRFLRVLEHRLQMRDLRRTAMMPTDEEGLRILARASGLAPNGEALRRRWEETKREVRGRHLKIFYAPLLSAVAELPEEELVLGGDEARARLASIGFRDPDGAMRHLSALTKGTSRRARIQRNLMPVLLRWLAEGTDPDYGLLAFRRVSEANTESPWYLRLLRDGSDAAERLTRVLSNSKFASELLVSIPEAVAWLERSSLLQPPRIETLLEEMRSLASRRASIDDAAAALRAVHRREILRLAMGRVAGVIDDTQVSEGLDAAHTALLDALLLALRRDGSSAEHGGIELAMIAMGRYGGREMGFGSDLDVMAVFRGPDDLPMEVASRTAVKLVSELRRLVSDPRFPVDLDFDLRPEGKNGPLARSLDGYRSYYERWSLTWEAQALLRARAVAGDRELGADFIALADVIRYPTTFGEAGIREVRRVKARVEAERLPRGVDPARHLKLGPGALSDVEWLAQLLQLRHGHQVQDLRTVSTLGALHAAVAHRLIGPQAVRHLEESWEYASLIRSSLKLWSGKSSDVLPSRHEDLEGIAGILGMPPGRTYEIEERWLMLSRRARKVFEGEFFEITESDDRFPIH